MIDITVYAGLFASAFVAATVLPMQSEALLVGLLLADYLPALLVLVASGGNVLGSVLNWMMGRGIERFRDHRWFPADRKSLERARDWYGRYGRWSLLLSWAPVIGDPLTVVAGIMRERLSAFLILVTIAKAGRYLALTGIVLGAT